MIKTKRQMLNAKAELRRLNLESQKIVESIQRRTKRIKTDQERVEKIERLIQERETEFRQNMKGYINE